jgi:hypothetical protein
VVEADVGGEAGRLEQAPVGLHEVVAPANRAEGIREDEPGVGPGLGGHTPLLGLAGAVGFQDLGGAGPIRTLRSWPVLVVVTRGLEELVSADLRTVMVGLQGSFPSSTYSHPRAASSSGASP